MTWYSRIFKDIKIINSRIKIEQDHSNRTGKHITDTLQDPLRKFRSLIYSIQSRFVKEIVAKQCYSRMTNSKCVGDKAEMSPIPSSALITNYGRRIKARILVTQMGQSFWPNKLELILWSNSHKYTTEWYYVIITKSTRSH